MRHSGLFIGSAIFLSIVCQGTGALALTADDFLNKPQYLPYLKKLEKYYPTEESRTAMRAEVNAILREFDRMRNAAAVKQPFKYKVATLAPDGTAWISMSRDYTIPFLEDVSGGLMGTTLFTGGVMGEDKDVLRKMKMGQLHGCGCSAQGVLFAAPELSVFSLPYLFRDYAEADYIMKKFRPVIEKILLEKGYMLYSLTESGNFFIFLRDKASTLDELRKFKFITWSGDVEKTYLANLGITAIPIPVTETLGAVRTGMANASIAPAAWILGMQAQSSIKYYVDRPVSWSLAAVLMEKDALDKEAKKYKVAQKDAEKLAELSHRLNTLLKVDEVWKDTLRDYETQCLSAFQSEGMIPLRLSDADQKEMEDAARKTWDDLAGSVYSRELLNTVISSLEEYRKKNARRAAP